MPEGRIRQYTCLGPEPHYLGIHRPFVCAIVQEESLVKESASLQASQAKVEAAQKQQEAERQWLTEQQRTLSNDQATLAAWRNDQVRPSCMRGWSHSCGR